MTPVLEEPVDEQSLLAAILPPSRVFTFEQLAAVFEDADVDTFRRQFSGFHASGAQVADWQRCAVTKLRIKPEWSVASAAPGLVSTHCTAKFPMPPRPPTPWSKRRSISDV